ncbi:MAG: DUF4258 domain-containing protein [bacterium]
MLETVYTTHARQRMALRKITDEMVRRTLEMPEEQGTGYRHRSLAYRRFPEGRIKVVYAEDQGRIVVITVMWEED